jgi:hypothetical protein
MILQSECSYCRVFVGWEDHGVIRKCAHSKIICFYLKSQRTALFTEPKIYFSAASEQHSIFVWLLSLRDIHKTVYGDRFNCMRRDVWPRSLKLGKLAAPQWQLLAMHGLISVSDYSSIWAERYSLPTSQISLVLTGIAFQGKKPFWREGGYSLQNKVKRAMTKTFTETTGKVVH